MIVADSSVWIDYFRGKNTPEADTLDSLLGNDLVAIGDLMLVEVLQGFRADRDYRKAKQLLLSLTVLNMLDTDIALKGAANFRKLKTKGITIRKMMYVIIATYCIEKKLPLLHSDRDFRPFHRHLKLKSADAIR